MHLRTLQHFAIVSRCHSIRQAAEQCHLTPTALARQLASLEHEFGAPLIERGPRGIRLTAAGELLAAQTQQTVRELDRVRVRINDLRGLRTGHISLYVSEGVLEGLAAPLLAQFSARYPEITLNIGTASAGDVVTALSNGEADIGMSFFIPASDNIERLVGRELPHLAVMSPNAPMSQSTSLTLSELSTLPLVLPPVGFAARHMLERAAHQAGITLIPRFTAASLAAQVALVTEGAAVALLPELAVRNARHTKLVTTVALQSAELNSARLDLCYAQNRPLGFAASALLDYLREHLLAL